MGVCNLCFDDICNQLFIISVFSLAFLQKKKLQNIFLNFVNEKCLDMQKIVTNLSPDGVISIVFIHND